MKHSFIGNTPVGSFTGTIQSELRQTKRPPDGSLCFGEIRYYAL